MSGIGSKPPNSAAAWQYRSQSLPRLASASAAPELGIPAGQQPLPPSSTTPSSIALQDTRFSRVTKTVAQCLSGVKTLSESVHKATSFRESCSRLLGAAISASLALQELLSTHCNSDKRELQVQRCAIDLQAKLVSADTLVVKYGQESWWHRFTRFESKAAVGKKLDTLQQELYDTSSGVWELIDPQNRVKRNVQADPEAGKMLTTGNAFSRHTLRQGGGGTRVCALLAFPDEDSSQGLDGMVVWAADNSIALTLPSSQWEDKITGAGVGLSCLYHDPRGYLWAGYSSGCVALYHINKATVAAEKLAVADATITALCVDPRSGLCWAGTEEGVVVVVSFTLYTAEGLTGRLDHVATLMAPGGFLPTTSSSSADSTPGSPSTISSSANTDAGSAAASTKGAYGSSTASCSRRGSQQQQNGSACGGSSSTSRVRSKGKQRRQKRRQQHSIAEVPGGGGTLGGWLSGGVHSMAGGSQRLREVTIHAGPVSAIAVSAGRAYTAGGSNGFNSTLLVWDTDSLELLKVISRKNSLYKSPTTCMTLVRWASTRRYPSSTGGGALGQYSSGAMQSMDASSSSSFNVNISSGHSTAGHTRSSSIGLPEVHLVTGHTNGNVIVWDPSGDGLQPVLLVGPERIPGSKKAVKAVVVLEELGVLACGHASGKVHMRKLDPNVPLHPKSGDIPRWNPTTFSLQAHRLGLHRMVGHGHMLITSGKTGSLKLWPETTLRCLASEAKVQLPFSRNPISEAVNSLLHRAGMMASAPSMPPLPHTPVLSTSAAGVAAGTPVQQGSSGLGTGQQQQQSAFAVANAGAAAGGAAAAAAAGVSRQQWQQQQFGDSSQHLHLQQQPPSPQQQQQDGSSSEYWSSDSLRATNWVIDWAALNIDINNRQKVIGQGSFGRVQIGCYNQTDVAVKVLTDAGSGSTRTSNGGGDHHSAATWDKVRLEKLLHEVGILSTLRHPNVVLFMGVCLSPPAVVTEYCPLRSLYDVLKKANSDAGLAARLTWQRRLRMALDAAKGMVHLHNHRPTILHRDLKSPNLFVMTNYTLKVGDFNLSRYMVVDTPYVQSSLELNPRWSAPEVIGSGHYSRAADVFAFGVCLWELLTWQEPWAEEEMSSYQIMTAVQQAAQRPQLPPLDQLPGQVGPAAAVAAYLALMEECWAQEACERPSFDQVVERLKGILAMDGQQQYPGTKAAAAAGGARPPAVLRGVSETAAMAAAAAAAAVRAAGDGEVPSQAAAAGTPAAAVAAVGPGGCHLRSRSEVVGGAAAAAAGGGGGGGGSLVGPDTADLLQLGQGDDDLPGPTAPRPPAAALPPIPGTSDEQVAADSGGCVGPAGGAAAPAGAGRGAALPPKPPVRGSSGSHAAAVAAAAAVAVAAGAGAAGSRAAGVVASSSEGFTDEEPYTPRQQQRQQQQQQGWPGTAAAGPVAAGEGRSPFASQNAQLGGSQQQLQAGGEAGLMPQQQQQQQRYPGLRTSPVGAGAAAVGGASPSRGSEDGSFAATPHSRGGRSPSGIRPSPFASTAAAAALVVEGCSSSSNNAPGASQDDGEHSSGFLAAPAFGSSSGQSSGGVTSPFAGGAALPVVNDVNVGDRLKAAVDAASAVAPESRKHRKSGSSSGGGSRATDPVAATPAATAAAAVGAVSTAGANGSVLSSPAPSGVSSTMASSRVEVESILGWHKNSEERTRAAVHSSNAAAGVPDLISLDSESPDLSAGPAKKTGWW